MYLTRLLQNQWGARREVIRKLHNHKQNQILRISKLTNGVGKKNKDHIGKRNF